VRGPLGFLRRHPVLFLLLLSPGLPEYLSGSSQLQALIISPPLFAFQLFANLGLYGPGVLLVREAMVRWRKGWATVLLLGAAYGILEEGVALSTLFNPNASVVGTLGYFGHWAGVSWVWTAGVLFVHMIYSISIPILLLSMFIPRTRGESLLRNRGILAAFTVLGLDVLVLVLVVAAWEHFWMGFPLLFSSFVAIGLLIYVSRRAPTEWPGRRPGPRRGLKTVVFAGALVFPAIIITQAVGASAGLPAAAVLVLVFVVEGLSLLWVVRNLSFVGNERDLLGFTMGLLIPLFATGLLSQFPLELVILADVALAFLFVHLFRTYGQVERVYPVADEEGEGTLNLGRFVSVASDLWSHFGGTLFSACPGPQLDDRRKWRTPP
jgi:hypothetical protein